MLEERIKKIIENTKAERISRELLFDGGFIKVFKEEYRLPDGRVITKQVVSKNGGKPAAIIAVRTVDDKFLLVFQNRVDNIVSCEFPSGYIEDGEDPIVGALREVKEETGYVSTDARILDEFISSIGTESTKIYIVFVDNAKKESSQELDKDEFINYEEFNFEELTYLVNNNFIQSSSNKLAYYHIKDIIQKK